MAEPLWAVGLLFLDREGNRRETSFRLPSGLSSATALPAALSLASVIAACSDALLISVSIHKKYRVIPIPVPAATSDVGRQGLTFYRNTEGVYELLAIPSLKVELLESTGLYAGIRLLAKEIAPGDPFTALEIALAATAKVDGSPWDYLYINGGLML